MIRSRGVALLVLGSLILAVAGQSAAQVRYVDEKGNSHWVRSESQVDAERARDQARFDAADDATQAAAAAKKQAASDKRLFRRCNSVRSDEATPALVAQCQRLLGR